jgi:hypothetical protein
MSWCFLTFWHPKPLVSPLKHANFDDFLMINWGILGTHVVNRQEIQLTQDLIELFVRYQVPPDLMSYDEAHGSRPEKLNRVSTAEKLKQALHGASKQWQQWLVGSRGVAVYVLWVTTNPS